jgi:hypothetical protein
MRTAQNQKLFLHPQSDPPATKYLAAGVYIRKVKVARTSFFAKEYRRTHMYVYEFGDTQKSALLK